MIEQQEPLRAYEWLLTAAVALIGTIILFDRSAGVNWAIWVALAVIVTLLCRSSAGNAPAGPQLMLGGAAIIAAGADARTTDVNVHVGIFWLTALLLGAFLSTILLKDWEEIGLLRLVTSPFRSAARVMTSSLRET